MKIKSGIIILTLAFSSLFLMGCDNKNSAGSSSDAGVIMSETIKKADKIEVVHFHATQQCWSCITVGKYALKTIQERFPKEYKKGIIVFRDINGELPENRDLVIKYQARGSSLFVNAIADGQDQIAEDVRVWRLIASEQAFMDYFENQLREFLS